MPTISTSQTNFPYCENTSARTTLRPHLEMNLDSVEALRAANRCDAPGSVMAAPLTRAIMRMENLFHEENQRIDIGQI